MWLNKKEKKYFNQKYKAKDEIQWGKMKLKLTSLLAKFLFFYQRQYIGILDKIRIPFFDFILILFITFKLRVLKLHIV